MNFYIRWFYGTFGGMTHQQKFCAEWDKTLNVLLDRHGDDAAFDRYTIQLGDIEVWVGNPFYAYGYAYRSGLPERRPSVRTMRRLDRIVQAHEAKIAEEYVEKLRGLRQ